MSISAFLLVFFTFADSANAQSIFCGATASVPTGFAAPVTAYIYNSGTTYRISADNLTISNSTMLPMSSSIKLATGDSTQCPVSRCLMNISTNQKRGDLNILQQENFLNLVPLGYDLLSPTTPMFCARISGDCGATVPIYRYFTLAPGLFNGIYYAYSFDPAVTYPNYLRDILPMCYGWPATATVTSLVDGSMIQLSSGFTFISSVTLIQDSGYNIIIDTPTATDTSSRDQMLTVLSMKALTTGMIHHVVTTHGHPDHTGQDNLFSSATQHYNNLMYTSNNFTIVSFQNGVKQLTPNVQLWMTPGHTPQDLSAVVSNVPDYGTVAIVGDLIFSADDVSNSAFWKALAWDATTGMTNRNKIICAADYIVPGHSTMFEVTTAMKTQAGC